MVIGPFINASAILLGGVLGALLSQHLPERIRISMTSIFGLCSLGIGILLVIKCANLPVMVLATLLGALIGEFCHLEKALIPLSPKRSSFSPNRMSMQHTNLSSKATWLSSCCFAPAGPGSSVRSMKG